MINTPFTVIYYVSNVPASCAFYTRIFERGPIESSPNFAMYELQSGAKFGLWTVDDVAPKVASPGTSGELAFRVEDQSEVDAIFARWKTDKADIAQAPTTMDFGYTFTVLDPDGHRLRVFSYPTQG